MYVGSLRLFKILCIISSFAFIIIFHELGHFVACTIFNVKVPVFSIGFGPALASTKKGSTLFQIAAIPLGGYVSIDQSDLDKKSYIIKMIIILAGIFNNVVLAFCILCILSLCNRKKAIPLVKKVLSHSPAQKSDIRADDRIVQIEGIDLKGSLQPLLEVLSRSIQKPLELVVERQNVLLAKTVEVQKVLFMGCPIGYLGIVFQNEVTNKKTVYTILYEGFSQTKSLIVEYLFVLGTFIKPINIVRIKRPLAILIALSQSVYQWHFELLFFMAAANVQLGMFNLIPIPMLDGGQAFIYTLQTITLHKLSVQNLIILHYTFLLCIIIYALYAYRKKA